jgi:glycosyltransferase involved in cell wall biosynthesis
MFEDLEVMATVYHLHPGRGLAAIIYNNMQKTAAAMRSAMTLIISRPLVYFAYPHSLTTVQNRALYRICRVLGLKIILDIHDTIEQAEAIGNGKSALGQEMESKCFRDAALILALNKHMWKYLAEKYKISGEKPVVFLANAYEDELCRIFPKPYQSVENRFNVCYVGGITRNRGIEMLVGACQTLHRKYPHLMLYIFGPYGEGISPDLKKDIEESSFIKRRTLPRMVLSAALKDMDVFVMPYDCRVEYMNFSSPTKIFEYIGTGKPILCTRCQSLLDLGDDGGIIYFDYSEDALAAEMESLIKDERGREEISRKIMALRQKHTWSRRASDLAEAIRVL